MKIAASNIAWSPEEEPQIAAVFESIGLENVEIAPTKTFEDPTNVTDDAIAAYLAFWKSHGVDVVAFQSMLFGRLDLTLFGSPDTRRELTEYMGSFISLAGRMGVERMVFGSPKNRQIPESMSEGEARSIAIDTFGAWGERAVTAGTVLCIEPNPAVYDTNFVINAASGIELVEAVDHPGFGLHLDAAGMTLAGDDLPESIQAAGGLLRHFHASAPQLGAVVEGEVDHSGAGLALARVGYEGYVSIEMRPGDDNAERLAEGVRVVRANYQVA